MDSNLLILLRSTKLQLKIYAFSIITVIVLVTIRILLSNFDLEKFDNYFFAILHGLIDSSVVVLLSLIFINTIFLIFFDRNNLTADLSPVYSHMIQDIVKRNSTQTQSFVFSLRTARYARLETIPSMSDVSKRLGRPISIVGSLPNPRKNLLMQQYAQHRNSIYAFYKEGKWDEIRTKSEIIASVIVINQINKNNNNMNLNLYFIDHISSYRIEQFSEEIIVTQEDPSLPGLSCKKDSAYFNMFATEMNLQRGNRLPIPSLAHVVPDSGIDEKAVAECCEILNIEDVSEELIEKIKDNILKGIHPYG